MIFTIGFKANYDRGIREMGVGFKKMGKRESFRGAPYLGGSVWRSREEAEHYLARNSPRLSDYSVYAVVAEWDKATEQLPGEPFRRLLVDAEIRSAY